MMWGVRGVRGVRGVLPFFSLALRLASSGVMSSSTFNSSSCVHHKIPSHLHILISPHLSSSSLISPHLPSSPLISPHLPSSPLISPHLPSSPLISPHLPSSPLIPLTMLLMSSLSNTFCMFTVPTISVHNQTRYFSCLFFLEGRREGRRGVGRRGVGRREGRGGEGRERE